MKDSMISALESMFTIQRWNFLPRTETWVEAENIAYVTHVAYAIGRANGMTPEQLECLILRSLLKSLNKHYMTDISLGVRDKFKELNPSAWSDLVNSTCGKTAGLFPRIIAEKLATYLAHSPKYGNVYKNIKDSESTLIEDLVKYSQLLVAKQECEINSKNYPSDYAPIMENISERMGKFKLSEEYNKIWTDHQDYFMTIKNLKYLRRWNRINRIVSSNVLGHTFLVSFLSIILTMLSIEDIKEKNLPLYQVTLRSLFHDVPESLTGDIITPVKREIERIDKTLLERVEKALQEEFIASAPSGVRDDIKSYELLTEINNKEIYSVTSMTKDCDRLAAVLECLYEKASGISTQEIDSAYADYLQDLGKSEWQSVGYFIKIIINSLNR